MSSKFPILSILVFASVLAAFTSTEAHADGKSPQWLRQTTGKPVPSYEKDVPAVVLHDEQQVTYGADGKLVSVENFAVKVLSREGRDFAVARAFYLVSSGKVREINAWLIRSCSSQCRGTNERVQHSQGSRRRRKKHHGHDHQPIHHSFSSRAGDRRAGGVLLQQMADRVRLRVP